MKAIPCEKLPRKLKISYKKTLFKGQHHLLLTRIEKGVGGPGAQLSMSTRSDQSLSFENQGPHRSTGSFINWYPLKTDSMSKVEG